MNNNFQSGSDSLLSISKIQEQLALLNKKMDMIINRVLPGHGLANLEKSINVSVQTPRVNNNHNQAKPMYQVICADCKKECSIPFKPSGERPVYCKDCFSRRKSGTAPKIDMQSKPVALAVTANEAKSVPAVKEKSKKAVVKKAVVKKKTVVKKKKSKK